ncbi:hypothetical protein RHSIM_Rhsim05G0219100 [Rhododendron simsii]|uniref:Uncharacterized protein n=1 Tax=Rhododendron simsii TaxID=118357 RepID=A0A834GY83_RHOSS|nr:hypothetical protein RHSIM_Rhsim05G0219100 [Rhododendron simsii]
MCTLMQEFEVQSIDWPYTFNIAADCQPENAGFLSGMPDLKLGLNDKIGLEKESQLKPRPTKSYGPNMRKVQLVGDNQRLRLHGTLLQCSVTNCFSGWRWLRKR